MATPVLSPAEKVALAWSDGGDQVLVYERDTVGMFIPSPHYQHATSENPHQAATTLREFVSKHSRATFTVSTSRGSLPEVSVCADYPNECHGGWTRNFERTLRFVPSKVVDNLISCERYSVSSNTPLSKGPLGSFQLWSQTEAYTKFSNRGKLTSNDGVFVSDDEDDGDGDSVGSSNTFDSKEIITYNGEDDQHSDDCDLDNDGNEGGHIEVSYDQQGEGFDCLFRIVLVESGVKSLELRDSIMGNKLAFQNLRKMFQNDTASITELDIPNLDKFSQDQFSQLIQSLTSNKCLKILNLSISWRSDQERTFGLEPLFKALVGDHPASNSRFLLRDLNIRWVNLSTSEFSCLAQVLPSAELETLRLCGVKTSDQASLASMFRGLKTNKSLKVLNISQTTITDPIVMEELCTALKENKFLQTLHMAHCGLKVGLVEILAKALPNFTTLRNLEMDGNDFCWTPRRLIVDQNDRYVGVFPVGPALLVDALEHNHCLQSLSVGEYRFGPGRDAPTICCVPPTYLPWLDRKTLSRLEHSLRRNEATHERNRKSKMQQAVIRLAGLLLQKI